MRVKFPPSPIGLFKSQTKKSLGACDKGGSAKLLAYAAKTKVSLVDEDENFFAVFIVAENDLHYLIVWEGVQYEASWVTKEVIRKTARRLVKDFEKNKEFYSACICYYSLSLPDVVSLTESAQQRFVLFLINMF